MELLLVRNMKSIGVLFCFLFVCNCPAQGFSAMFSLNLDKKTKSYASVDGNNSNVVLCFFNDEKTKMLLLDEKTAFLDSMEVKSFPNYKKTVTDYTSNKTTKIVLANQDFTSFLIHKIDFNTKKESFKNFSFETKTRRILQMFFSNDLLYTISISTENKSLIITQISNEEIISETIVKAGDGAQETLNKLYAYAYATTTNKFPLLLIKENQYYPFSETKSLSKCYLRRDSLIICVDQSSIETEILTLSLKDKTVTNSRIKRELSEERELYNSLIVDNNLIQVEHGKSNYNLVIKDLQGNLIKKFSDTELQKVKYFTEFELGKIEEIDSKKYFRKVDEKEIGISCTKNNGNLYLSIGSATSARMPASDEETGSYSSLGYVAGGMSGALIGSIIDTALNTSNLHNYGEYITKGQTYNQIRLDSSFNAVDFSKKDFSYIKLKKQIINSSKFSIPSIFQIKDLYYLGYYDRKEKRCFIMKFNNY